MSDIDLDVQRRAALKSREKTFEKAVKKGQHVRKDRDDGTEWSEAVLMLACRAKWWSFDQTLGPGDIY